MKIANCIASSKGDNRDKRQLLRDSLPRGLALFLGGFGLLNILGNFRVSGFDANVWWIDLRWLPGTAATPLLLVAVLCLIAFGVRPPRSVWRPVLTVTCAALLGIAALVNSAQFYVLLKRGPGSCPWSPGVCGWPALGCVSRSRTHRVPTLP